MCQYELRSRGQSHSEDCGAQLQRETQCLCRRDGHDVRERLEGHRGHSGTSLLYQTNHRAGGVEQTETPVQGFAFVLNLLPRLGGRQNASPETQRLSELRIVLLGWRGVTGKSSSGNTILGREAFNTERWTEQSEKSQGEVAGRQVTVVDTPGWLSDSVQATPECVKQEIVRSVSLCPPGPHALLLAIPVGSYSFTERQRRTAQEHLELLSERVWRHTIVLFTGGDRLRDTTIEQHIERGGEELQWLVEKCGNRYHVLHNRDRGDGTQVTELLDKIEQMVAGNKERTGSPETQRLSELRIVLLGGRVIGKSLSGNTILGREVFRTGRWTVQSEKSQGEVAGRQVTVVDTPGWWWSHSVQKTPECVKQEIVRSVSLCPPGPHALLLAIPVLSYSFTERERRTVQEHLELLSERVWRHTIVLFTGGDRLRDTTIEQHIERGGEELQRLVEKCGNRYHVLNNRDRSDGTQVTELLDKIEEMVVGLSVFQYRRETGGLQEKGGKRSEERGGEKQRDEEEEKTEREEATLPVRRRHSKERPPGSKSV
ncbi:GIMA8 GTPase, partial [Amia calva]|nr:GIMA8 GTPase [Amia calva]